MSGGHEPPEFRWNENIYRARVLARQFTSESSMSDEEKRADPQPTWIYLCFPLADGNDFEMRVRRRVSRKDFERIKSLIELAADAMCVSEEDDVKERAT